MPVRRYPNRALAFRRLIVTTTRQGASAPVIDRCWGGGESRQDDPRWPRLPGWLAPECEFRYSGFAIRLAFWRRDRWDGPPLGLALVVGWVTERKAVVVPVR